MNNILTTGVHLLQSYRRYVKIHISVPTWLIAEALQTHTIATLIQTQFFDKMIRSKTNTENIYIAGNKQNKCPLYPQAILLDDINK